MPVMVVLVTGGAGYIGSHTVLALQRAAHEVIVVDNCANSPPVALAGYSNCPAQHWCSTRRTYATQEG